MANGEAALNLVVENEAIRAVPVVGTAFKFLKGLDDIRSRLFAAKLARFLSDPALRAAAEARQLRQEMLKADETNREDGETLLLVLEKVTDMSKPVLIANAFAAYLDDVIEQGALLRLLHVIDISSTLDLETFIQHRGGNVENEMLWRERLGGSGLLVSYVSAALGGSEVEYGLAPLGDMLLHVIDHCTKCRQQG